MVEVLSLSSTKDHVRFTEGEPQPSCNILGNLKVSGTCRLSLSSIDMSIGVNAGERRSECVEAHYLPIYEVGKDYK